MTDNVFEISKTLSVINQVILLEIQIIITLKVLSLTQ